MKELLFSLLELGLDEAEFENGIEVRGLRLETGSFPNACQGWVVAVVDGREIRLPHRLECQSCGGCE